MLADIGSDVRFKQANSATKSALDTVLHKKREKLQIFSLDFFLGRIFSGDESFENVCSLT